MLGLAGVLHLVLWAGGLHRHHHRAGDLPGGVRLVLEHHVRCESLSQQIDSQNFSRHGVHFIQKANEFAKKGKENEEQVIV